MSTKITITPDISNSIDSLHLVRSSRFVVLLSWVHHFFSHHLALFLSLQQRQLLASSWTLVTHTHTHTFRAISWFLLDSEPRLISPANQTLSRAWEGLSEESSHYKTQLSNQFTEALTTDTLELRAVEPASYQPSDQLFKYSALRHWHIYTTICKMDNCYMAQGAQLSALWSPRGIGRAGEALEGGDIWTHIADSLGCTTETNITIYSNYTPTIIF